uniref:Cytochrome c oxidase subunit 2 n=1 Tax=Champsodon cf. snyderi CBM-ZF 10876 TaxID=270612 RepID=T2HTQ0_9TELE|nr:cytochrome c oxidase subunit II [Champsodon cf. snyderi CBM-ZF 10876]BAN83375.1 cytochrome c oxidase subunit 2 [Champsodon cf. snyderi CBM-ZF 10876]
MSHASQLGFQDAASPMMEEFIHFHDHLLMVTIAISTFILYMLVTTVTTKLTDNFTQDSQELEIVWTLLPSLILLFIAIPSVRILYLTEEHNDIMLTIKAIGHQWYWNYEYTDFGDLQFDSYMAQQDNLLNGTFRFLDCDNRMVVPVGCPIRMLITSEDVIHSWAVPALGVKMDAVPGRLNQTTFNALRPGLYFGQCSEICGANHSFMPITVEVVSVETFNKWTQKSLN